MRQKFPHSIIAKKNYCPWGDIFHASIYYIFALIHFRSIPLICKWVGMQSWIRIGICITLHGFCFRVNIWRYILSLWLCKSNWIYFNSCGCIFPVKLVYLYLISYVVSKIQITVDVICFCIRTKKMTSVLYQMCTCNPLHEWA